MAKARTLVGLDVHAAKVVAAILDSETGELRFQRLGGETAPVVRLCSSFEGPVRASYEAGPTGYGLARALDGGRRRVRGRGAREDPARANREGEDRPPRRRAPGPTAVGRQAPPVRVPGPPEEAMRDLVRAREDIRQDLMRARHRLSKLLLRHGIRFEGRAWSERHRAWLARVELAEQPAQATLRGLPRRGRGAGPSKRRTRAPDRRPGPRLALGAGGRTAALPARRRHPDRGRALRRDRRLRALRARPGS